MARQFSIERHLVIGLVSESWHPDPAQDSDITWAVNARVLSLEPLGLPLRDEPLPRRPAVEPQTDVQGARRAVAADSGVRWNNARQPWKSGWVVRICWPPPH